MTLLFSEIVEVGCSGTPETVVNRHLRARKLRFQRFKGNYGIFFLSFATFFCDLTGKNSKVLIAAMDCLAHITNYYNDYSYKIVKMVIPKGAKMVYGRDGDIVSTSLRTGSLQALATFEREQALTLAP